MTRWFVVALLGCNFHHGAIQQPGGDAPIPDAPGDGSAVPDAFVFRDAAAAAIAFVQGNGVAPGLNADTVAVPFTGAEAAHDLNLVVVSWQGAAASVTGVSDLALDTYTQIGTPIINSTWVLDVWVATDINASATNVVTATFDATVANPELRVLEYAGLATVSPLDVTAEGNGSGNKAVSSGSTTTTHAHDVIVGCELSNDSVKTAGTGFTTRVTAGGDTVEDMVVATAGSYTATATLNNNATWIMRLVALKGVP